MGIITKFSQFVALNEQSGGTQKYTGFYRTELVGPHVEVRVTGARYHHKTGAIEFACKLSTVDEVLKDRKLTVTIVKGGMLTLAPDADTQVYLDANPTTQAELSQLAATVNTRGQVTVE